jgi:hypothetical protein
VINNEADILQIQKYLNGELTERAMHELERRSQSDPFLAEALEGYETTGNKQDKNLSDLSARLMQRIAPKKGRVVPLWMISAAASVLIVCSVGVWWLSRKPTGANETHIIANAPVEKKALPAGSAKTDSVAVKQQKQVIAQAKIPARREKAKVYATEKVTEPPKPEDVLANVPAEYKNTVSGVIKDSVQKDTTALNEMIVMGYTSKKKDTSALLKKSVAIAFKAKPIQPTDQLLQGQAAGVTDNNDVAPVPPKDYTLDNKTIPAKTLSEVSIANNFRNNTNNIIGGRVIARNDGSPLSNATVKVAGTNNGTRTDANGYFTLPVDTGKSTLIVNHSGYDKSQYNTNSGDLSNTITLKPNTTTNNNAGFTAANSTSNSAVIYAHPQLGWDNYKEYLKKNAISPDGKTGLVKLSFKVSANGTISAFKIRQGVSPKTNQKAIDLINEGPSWIGNSDGQTKMVNLTVQFGK